MSAAPRVGADGDRAIAACPTKQLVLRALRASEKRIALAAVGLEGRQFAPPIIVARAGTVMVRTTNVCRLVVRHSWGIAQHSHAWRSGRDQDEAVAAADRGVGISDPRDHRDRPVGPQGRGRPPFPLGGVVRA